MLVIFTEEEDQPMSIVPIKRVRECDVRNLKEGVMCKVEWSDRNVYSAEVLAAGMLIVLKGSLQSMFNSD